MENPKSNDEKALIEIFKVMSWLDDIRWNQAIEIPSAFTYDVLKDNNLKEEQKVLIHWLLYITDRGRRAEVVWEDNTPKIKELVVKYFNKEEISTEKQLIAYLEEWEKKYYSEEATEDNGILQAYPSDVKSIERTLLLLLNYDKNIIYFMTRKLSEWKTAYAESFCSRVAFSLYLLSYKGVGRLKKTELSQNQEKLNKKILEILKGSKFEEEFGKWYGGDKRWHKRTWAALRDYKKWRAISEIFVQGVKNETKNVWEENFNNQLELPGDIWNVRFFKNCIKPIAEKMGVEVKSINSPKVVRELWGKIKSDCPKSHPEQFDITYDFAPRMCEKKFCSICVFGPNGATSVCSPSKDKYCPVALISCGYITKCSEDKCIIKEGIGKGRCKGIGGT